jgi:hypothetical protein
MQGYSVLVFDGNKATVATDERTSREEKKGLVSG